ncbi:hypothetical protein RUM43_011528 [Polyplax serrata]|uniref:Protein YIPF n=1 Tax=Polyplax serrata TaxID=468196 RepID=A0AAN8P931_POLSC
MSGYDNTSVNIPDFVSDVEGDILVPNSKHSQDPRQPDFNTLDEPIKQTVMRDLKAVCVKFKYVLFPRDKESQLLLKEWDLWGPLMLCTFMAVFLQGSSDKGTNDGGPEFAEVFVIVWVGAMIVTLNSKLLGGHMSFFQSVCVLGYCLLSPAIALILCRAVLLAGRSMTLFLIRLLIALSAFVWSTASCMVFLGQSQAPGRKILAGYPVCLFYAIISWLIISHTD